MCLQIDRLTRRSQKSLRFIWWYSKFLSRSDRFTPPKKRQGVALSRQLWNRDALSRISRWHRNPERGAGFTQVTTIRLYIPKARIPLLRNCSFQIPRDSILANQWKPTGFPLFQGFDSNFYLWPIGNTSKMFDNLMMVDYITPHYYLNIDSLK